MLQNLYGEMFERGCCNLFHIPYPTLVLFVHFLIIVRLRLVHALGEYEGILD